MERAGEKRLYPRLGIGEGGQVCRPADPATHLHPQTRSRRKMAAAQTPTAQIKSNPSDAAVRKVRASPNKPTHYWMPDVSIEAVRRWFQTQA
jgi:hypothetical protein